MPTTPPIAMPMRDRGPADAAGPHEDADERDRHADHREAVAAPRGGRRVQLVQAVDEERDRDQVGEVDPRRSLAVSPGGGTSAASVR